MKYFFKYLFTLIVSCILLFVIGVLAAMFLDNGTITGIDVETIKSYAMDPIVLGIVGFGALVITLMFASSAMKGKKDTGEAKVKERGDVKKYYDTNWVSAKELKTNDKYMFCPYSKLRSLNKVGVPIRAELVGNDIQVNMYNKDFHCLVIGTTGAGKTTQFINPTIQIYSETSARPSLVITDPKGEIYDLHSAKLKSRGYNLMVFDLKEPFKSTCWNPMTRPYEMHHRALNLESEVKVHQGGHPSKYNLKYSNDDNFKGEWYEFEGMALGNKEAMRNQVENVRQQLKNEAYEDLKDISIVLCPIEGKDPIWERGARDMILGVMMGMLEDSENPELGMTKEKFNFFNLAKICNLKDNDAYNPIKSLTEYFQGRGKLSIATQLANQVVTNADKTAKSYMGVVTDRMGLFADTGVCFATSKNEMDFSRFDEEPTALFIKIPDEKTTRHAIATMFISQLYKILVATANSRGGALKKPVYFLLDEFANMPKIEDFKTVITVARSRRIFFTLIVQSYSQLTIQYGEEVGNIVKDNCNIHIYIASNDQGTKEEFSKRCGNISVETESTTISKGDGSGDEKQQKSKTTSVSLESRPLIYPEELGSLKDEFIVSVLKENPMKTKFTPSYKATKVYRLGKAQEEFKVPQVFNEIELYYDIRERNKKVLKNDNNQGHPGGGNFGLI